MSKRTDLAGIISNTTLSKGASKKYTRELAAYIIDNRLGNELDSIMRDVQSDWSEAGYLEVLAASAHPLTDALKSEIKSQVKLIEPKAKTIVITEVYDPEVIGGVKISLPGRQLDLSVEAKLNKFKSLTRSGKE